MGCLRSAMRNAHLHRIDLIAAPQYLRRRFSQLRKEMQSETSFITGPVPFPFSIINHIASR